MPISLNLNTSAIVPNSNANAADKIVLARSDLSQSSPQNADTQALAFQDYLEKNYGLSAHDVNQATGAPVSMAEVNAQLLADGTDPNTATPQQRTAAATKINLGKQLGLTPVQAAQVMAASTMSTKDLQSLMPTSQIGAIQGNSALAAIRGTDSIQGVRTQTSGFQMSINLGPPTPKMSITAFMNAIATALDTVLGVKASNQMRNAEMERAKLRDIVIQTTQKIQMSNEANAEMVSNLRTQIETMKTMRILLYCVVAFVVLVMLIIDAVCIFFTAGAATPEMIALTVMVTVALIGAVMAMITTIAITEATRKGQMHLTDEQMAFIMVAELVADIVLAVISGGALVAAEETIVQIVIFIIEQVIQMSIQLITLAISIGLVKKIAGAMATKKYQASDEKKDVDETAQTKISGIQAQQSSGSITTGEANVRIAAATNQQNVQNSNNQATFTTNEENEINKTLDIVNWVLLALSIGVGMGASLLPNIIKKVSKAIADSVKAVVDSIKKLVEKIRQAMQKGLKGLVESLTKAITGAVQKLFQAAKKIVETLIAAVRNFTKQVETEGLGVTLEKLLHSLYQKILQLVAAIGRLVGRSAKAVVGTASEDVAATSRATSSEGSSARATSSEGSSASATSSEGSASAVDSVVDSAAIDESGVSDTVSSAGNAGKASGKTAGKTSKANQASKTDEADEADEAEKTAAAEKLKQKKDKKQAWMDKQEAIVGMAQQVGQIIIALTTAGQSITEGALTIKQEESNQKYLKESLEIQNMIVQLDAIKTLWQEINDNLNESARQGNDSISKLIDALSTIFNGTADVITEYADAG